MKSLTSLLVSGHIADTVARIIPNPLLRSGATAFAARWAMRSVPAALAVVAAGAAYRYFTKDDTSPERKTRSRPSRSAKRPAKSAKKPGSAARQSAPASAAA